MKLTQGRLFFWIAIHSFLERFTFIYAVIVPILHGCGVSALFITVVFALHEICKVVFEWPTGLLCDFIHPIFVLIFGVALKAFSLLIMGLFPNRFVFLIGMCIFGVGRAFVYSKIEPYAYQTLSKIFAESLFTKLMFVRSTCGNLSSIFIGLLVSTLHKTIGFSGILLMSATIVAVVHIPLLFFLFPRDIFVNRLIWKDFPTGFSSKILIAKKSFLSIAFDRGLCWIIIVSGLLSSLFFLVTDIHKVFMTDVGFPLRVIGFVYTLAHILPFVSSIIFVKYTPRLSIRFVTIATTLCLFFLVVSLLIYLLFGVTNFCVTTVVLLYLCFYPVVSSVTAFEVSNVSGEHSRFTVSSFSHFIASCFNVLVFLLFGFVSNFIGVSHAMVVTFFVIVLILLLILYLRQFIKSNVSA